MHTDEKAATGGDRHGCINSESDNPNYARVAPPRIGRFSWRKAHELLTVTDRIFIYRAPRAPRGDYKTPMPEDIMDCWRAKR